MSLCQLLCSSPTSEVCSARTSRSPPVRMPARPGGSGRRGGREGTGNSSRRNRGSRSSLKVGTKLTSWAVQRSGLADEAGDTHCHSFSGDHARDIFAKPVFKVRSRPHGNVTQQRQLFKACESISMHPESFLLKQNAQPRHGNLVGHTTAPGSIACPGCARSLSQTLPAMLLPFH